MQSYTVHWLRKNAPIAEKINVPIIVANGINRFCGLNVAFSSFGSRLQPMFIPSISIRK